MVSNRGRALERKVMSALVLLLLLFVAQLATVSGIYPDGTPDKVYTATGTAPWWFEVYVTKPTYCWNGVNGRTTPCYKMGCGYNGYNPCQPLYNETCMFTTAEMKDDYFDRIVEDDIEPYVLPQAGTEGIILNYPMYMATEKTPLYKCKLNHVSYNFCWEYQLKATELGIYSISNSTWAQFQTYRSITCVEKTEYNNLRKTDLSSLMYTTNSAWKNEPAIYDVNDDEGLFYIYESNDGYSRLGMKKLDTRRAVSLYDAIMLNAVQVDLTCKYKTAATAPVPTPAPAVVATVPAPTPTVPAPVPTASPLEPGHTHAPVVATVPVPVTPPVVVATPHPAVAAPATPVVVATPHPAEAPTTPVVVAVVPTPHPVVATTGGGLVAAVPVTPGAARHNMRHRKEQAVTPTPAPVAAVTTPVLTPAVPITPVTPAPVAVVTPVVPVVTPATTPPATTPPATPTTPATTPATTPTVPVTATTAPVASVPAPGTNTTVPAPTTPPSPLVPTPTLPIATLAPFDAQEMTMTSCLFFKTIQQNYSPRIETQKKLPVKYRFDSPEAYPNLPVPQAMSEKNPQVTDMVYLTTNIVNVDGTKAYSDVCFGDYGEYQGEDGEWYNGFPAGDGERYNLTHVYYARDLHMAASTIQTYWNPSLNDTLWNRNIRLKIKCDLTIPEAEALGWIYFTAGGVKAFDCVDDTEGIICPGATKPPKDGSDATGKDILKTEQGKNALYVMAAASATSLILVTMYYGRKAYYDNEALAHAVSKARQAEKGRGGAGAGSAGPALGGGMSAAERILEARGMQAKQNGAMSRRHLPGNGNNSDDDLIYNSILLESHQEQEVAANIFGVLAAADSGMDLDSEEEEQQDHNYI